MPTMEVMPLRQMDNAYIMDAVRADSSLAYQQRIPAATDAGVRQAVEQLYNHRPSWNEFIDALCNRIGLVLARNISWTNPLAQFKRGMLQFGDTIEEIQVGLLQAHTYDPDREYMEEALFGTERPDVKSIFHKINRQNYYRVTINHVLLQRAFLEEGGLAAFIGQLIQAPMTSDQMDEWLLTCSLFKQYEANGGFHHVHVPDVASLSSTGDDAKMALRKMRALTQTLAFPSTRYNAAKMPSFAKPEDLVLFATPEFIAGVDVEALAGAFHVDKLEASQRMIPVPQENLDIDGAQAILTTRDFFVIADTYMAMTQQPNAVGRQTNYFLHHDQILSTSLFAPAILFTTGADDEIITIHPSVTSVAAPVIEPIDGSAVTEVTRGAMIALSATVTDSPTGSAPNVFWSITSPVTSQRTWITPTGVLHCGADETATSITVRATSTLIDSSDPRLDAQYAEVSVPVTGNGADKWPEQSNGITAIVIDGEAVANVAPATLTYSLALPAGSTVTDADVDVTTDGPADVNVTVTKVTGGYTVTIAVDDGVGAATTYTVNVTA